MPSETFKKTLPIALLTVASVAGAGSFIWKQSQPIPLVTPSPVPTSTSTPDPQIALDNELRTQIVASLNAAPRVHLKTLTSSGAVVHEIWREKDQYRSESNSWLLVFNGKKAWILDKSSKTAYVWQKSQPILAMSNLRFDRIPRNSLSSVIQEMALNRWNLQNDNNQKPIGEGSVLPRFIFNGKIVRGEGVLAAGDGNVQTLVLSPDSPLPLKETVPAPQAAPSRPAMTIKSGPGAMRMGSGRSPRGASNASGEMLVTTLSYAEAPPAGTFPETPPSGTVIVNVDERNDYWRSRLTAVPIATLNQGEIPCKIHDVQVGKGGEIFVVYTGTWPTKHRKRNSQNQVVFSGKTTYRDDQNQTYHLMNSVNSLQKTYFAQLAGEVDPWKSGIPPLLAVLSPLGKVSASPSKTLTISFKSANDTQESAQVTLPPVLATEEPEYLRISNASKATLTLPEQRRKAKEHLILAAMQELREGRPAKEVANECETIASEGLGNNLSWEVALQLALLHQKAENEDLLRQRANQARQAFLDGQGPGKAPLPRELQALMERLEP